VASQNSKRPTRTLCSPSASKPFKDYSPYSSTAPTSVKKKAMPVTTNGALSRGPICDTPSFLDEAEAVAVTEPDPGEALPVLVPPAF
jgi:hypothetical protein